MKNKIHSFLMDEVRQKITELQSQIEQIQEAVNQEGKSTAGDKHETGRAMAQLEVEQCSKLLREKELMYNQLLKINLTNKHTTIGLGSLIECDGLYFYISLGFGKRSIENKEVFCIGVQSPIYNELKGKQKGDHFQFMKKEYVLLRIE